MRRRPAALAVPVLTIAVGIGASTAVESLAVAHFSRSSSQPSVFRSGAEGG